MSETKRIVCLANSRKYQGRCIAGIEVLNSKPGGWVRPVSNREMGELYDFECKLESGKVPSVLDIIDVPVKAPKPARHQNENWLIDAASPWVKSGRCPVSSLARVAETDGKLWVNGFETAHGKNNRVPIEAAASFDRSLRLIRVESLTIVVTEPRDPFGDERTSIRAEFKFAGDWYRLSITDHTIEDAFLTKGKGRYCFGLYYLTVSLGEEFKGHYYKLVAAAIEVKP